MATDETWHENAMPFLIDVIQGLDRRPLTLQAEEIARRISPQQKAAKSARKAAIGH